MFPRRLQDFSRMFSGCSDGSCGPGGIWWSFHMKVWTLMTHRNSMIANYSMIPAKRWSPANRWSPAIRWSMGSMDFDNPIFDTSVTDGLVFLTTPIYLNLEIYVYVAAIWTLQLILGEKLPGLLHHLGPCDQSCLGFCSLLLGLCVRLHLCQGRMGTSVSWLSWLHGEKVYFY